MADNLSEEGNVDAETPTAGVEADVSTIGVPRPSRPIPALRLFESRHKTTIRDSEVSFRAVAKDTYLYDDEDQIIGTIFSYSYLRDNVDTRERPVIFITGGGPGGAVGGIQCGYLGPWVTPSADTHPDNLPTAIGPYRYEENENCLLDVADLVFLDPVGTGYSRPLGTGIGADFWGTDEDADSVAQFIQLWIADNGRWDSPKFFAGSSYGGSRGPLVADSLMGGPFYQGYLRGIALNGVITLDNGLGLPIGFEGAAAEEQVASKLPVFAAAAWYHHKVDRAGRSLDGYFNEVREFAFGDYLAALRSESSNELDKDRKATVVEKAANYIGLHSHVFEGQLSLSEFDFSQKLLEDQGLVIGLYDARFTSRPAGNDAAVDDASLSIHMPRGVAAWANIERERLGVRISVPYAAVAWRTVLAGWNFQRRTPVMAPIDTSGTAAQHMARLMARNHDLHLFIGGGMFDMVAYGAMGRYMAAKASIPEERLMVREYVCGHDATDDDSRVALLEDLREFVLRAL